MTRLNRNIPKISFVFAAVCFLFACVQVKQDYVVKENSLHSSSAPAWIYQSRAHKADASSDTKQYRYFVSDAQNANQRLCLKLSENNATKKAAADAAAEIVKKLERKSKNKAKEDHSQLKDTLEKNVLVNLFDVAVVGEYWEKRVYQKETGVGKDRTAYKCDTVVKIKKTAFVKALEAYKAKAHNEIKKPLKSAIDSYITTLKAEK